MAYYSILEVTPITDEWIPDYLPTANQLVAKHGGKYLARTQTHEQLEGSEKKAALRIIIEWKSEAGAKAFMADPTYARHLQNRTEGSTSYHYLVAGKDDLT